MSAAPSGSFECKMKRLLLLRHPPQIQDNRVAFLDLLLLNVSAIHAETAFHAMKLDRRRQSCA